MSWREILQNSSRKVGKSGKSGNSHASFSSFSGFSKVQERKPTMKQVMELSSLMADFEERAAIMEYDGGLHREHAEALALDIIVWQMKQENREWSHKHEKSGSTPQVSESL